MAVAKGAPDPKKKSANSDLIDDDISFDQRDMHKTWPLVKGCLMLFGGVVVFIWISLYVFRTFKAWF